MSADQFNEKSVLKIAQLARLKLTDSEALELSRQLGKVIAHFDEIAMIDTHNVEPLITPTDIEYFVREDLAEKKYSAEQMLENAPEKQGHLFKVPPVV